jgi:hypothetical protein
MNFNKFLNKLTTSDNHTLIEAIRSGYEVLTESLNSDIIHLYKYFSYPVDELLPYDYSYLIDEYEVECETPNNWNEMESYEKAEWLYTNNKEEFKKFGRYIEGTDEPHQDGHTRLAFDDSPVYVKNEWLVHFTNDAYDILKDGFTYGTDEIDKLGLTTHYTNSSKKGGQWAFAYKMDKFSNTYNRNRGSELSKYGNECIVFKGSGIELTHYGDEEDQVIFDTNTANTFISIELFDDEEHGDVWAVMNQDRDLPIYHTESDDSDDFEKCVYWIRQNYKQYKKKMH